MPPSAGPSVIIDGSAWVPNLIAADWVRSCECIAFTPVMSAGGPVIADETSRCIAVGWSYVLPQPATVMAVVKTSNVNMIFGIMLLVGSPSNRSDRNCVSAEPLPPWT